MAEKIAQRISFYFPPGHFYSPWPDPDEALAAVGRAENTARAPVAGLDLDDAAMLDLWDELVPLMKNAPFKPEASQDYRYRYENEFFSYGDGQIYFGMIARFKPRRIVEIGSGFSSALALDTRDYLGLDIRMTLIEPHTQSVRNLLRSADYTTIELLEKKVQDVDQEIFASLERNDFVFIDSSHVLKTGSDVCFELFNILPVLRSGVLVHFHDIFYPFEYPRRWVEEKRAWNEIYAIRAVLMYNSAYKVVFFNDYFARKFAHRLDVPGLYVSRNPGGGLWLRRV